MNLFYGKKESQYESLKPISEKPIELKMHIKRKHNKKNSKGSILDYKLVFNRGYKGNNYYQSAPPA